MIGVETEWDPKEREKEWYFCKAVPKTLRWVLIGAGTLEVGDCVGVDTGCGSKATRFSLSTEDPWMYLLVISLVVRMV